MNIDVHACKACTPPVCNALMRQPSGTRYCAASGSYRIWQRMAAIDMPAGSTKFGSACWSSVSLRGVMLANSSSSAIVVGETEVFVPVARAVIPR